MSLQTELLSSEKEDLLAAMETIRSNVRQLEAQNQELQRQSASVDRDLLTERVMKEQKIKVEMFLMVDEMIYTYINWAFVLNKYSFMCVCVCV